MVINPLSNVYLRLRSAQDGCQAGFDKALCAPDSVVAPPVGFFFGKIAAHPLARCLGVLGNALPKICSWRHARFANRASLIRLAERPSVTRVPYRGAIDHQAPRNILQSGEAGRHPWTACDLSGSGVQWRTSQVLARLEDFASSDWRHRDRNSVREGQQVLRDLRRRHVLAHQADSESASRRANLAGDSALRAKRPAVARQKEPVRSLP